MVTKALAEIIIGPRHRKDLGDIAKLADSIENEGLLHPIGITAAGELVFGARRFAAYKRLERAEIPARIVNVTSIASGEFHENEMRKEFTPSERAAILETIKRKPQGRPNGKSQDLASFLQAAKLAGFGNAETARQARRVAKCGIPEVVAAMDEGGLAIDAAALVADVPPDQQKTIMDMPEESRREAIRHLGYRQIRAKAEAKELRAGQMTTIPLGDAKKAVQVLVRRWTRRMLQELYEELGRRLEEIAAAKQCAPR